jgi:protein-tyrosine-phosphatase
MEEAVIAAAERGADIRDLRATPVSRALVGRADLVVTMTEEQRDEVLEHAPDAGGKVFTLKQLVALLAELPLPSSPPDRAALLERIRAADRLRRGPDAPLIPDPDVSDPLGLALDAYRAVAWELDRLVDGMVEGLFGKAAPSPRRTEASEG